MLQYKASAVIEASPERVWEVLMDGGAYPQWDPYCERIEGTIAPGEKIKAFTTLAPGRAFPVKVQNVKPARGMTWEGGMPLGLFKGVRSFSLEPQGEHTRFEVAETFTGPLLVLFKKTLPDMNEPFAAFVKGLKARAEG